MKTYIQSLFFEPTTTCDVCGEHALAQVRNLMTGEVVTTLCDRHLEEEGWV